MSTQRNHIIRLRYVTTHKKSDLYYRIEHITYLDEEPSGIESPSSPNPVDEINVSVITKKEMLSEKRKLAKKD